MIIDISKEEITNELLEAGLVWMDKGVSTKTVKNTKKYLCLNWDNLSVESFLEVLPNLNKDHITKYLFSDKITNKDILFNMYKHIELPNEEYLWNDVVSARYISHEIYQKNTYEENFDIWFKMNSDRLEKMPKYMDGNSYQEYLDGKNNLEIQNPKQTKEAKRRNRVCDWLDSIIDIKYSLEDFSDVKDYLNDRVYVEFSFKKGNFVPSSSLSFVDLEKLPTHKQTKYTIDLMGKTAFSTTIWGNKSFGDYSLTNEMMILLQRENLPQTIENYIKFWVSDRIGEINLMK